MDTIYRTGHDAQMEIKSEEREKHRFDEGNSCRFQEVRLDQRAGSMVARGEDGYHKARHLKPEGIRT